MDNKRLRELAEAMEKQRKEMGASDESPLLFTLLKEKMGEPKGMAAGGYVRMADIMEQENAEKQALEAAQMAKEQEAVRQQQMQEAEAMNAFARAKAQQEGQMLYNNALQNPSDSIATTQAAAKPADLFQRVSSQMNNQVSKGNLDPEQQAVRNLASKGKGAVGAVRQLPEAEKPGQPSSAYGESLGDDMLHNAQDGANLLRLTGGLANAGSTIGAALSRGAAKPVEIGNDVIKNADQGVKDIMQRREAKDKDAARQKVMMELDNEKLASDPNSNISKSLRDGLKMVMPGLNIPENTSAQTLRNMGVNMGTLVTAKLAADARVDAARERAALAKEKSDDKKEKDARLSDKQTASVTEFDDSVDKMQNAIGLLGNKSSWVGQVDGRIPDMLVGSDQAAFRAAVGRMKDAYRKLVTGAGASNLEIARLESRIPSETDTYKNFMAKANEFIKEVKKAKSTYLNNYEKQGKNVKNFREGDDPGNQKSTTSNSTPNEKVIGGKRYKKVEGGWEEIE